MTNLGRYSYLTQVWKLLPVEWNDDGPDDEDDAEADLASPEFKMPTEEEMDEEDGGFGLTLSKEHKPDDVFVYFDPYN